MAFTIIWFLTAVNVDQAVSSAFKTPINNTVWVFYHGKPNDSICPLPLFSRWGAWKFLSLIGEDTIIPPSLARMWYTKYDWANLAIRGLSMNPDSHCKPRFERIGKNLCKYSYTAVLYSCINYPILLVIHSNFAEKRTNA